MVKFSSKNMHSIKKRQHVIFVSRAYISYTCEFVHAYYSKKKLLVGIRLSNDKHARYSTYIWGQRTTQLILNFDTLPFSIDWVFFACVFTIEFKIKQVIIVYATRPMLLRKLLNQPPARFVGDKLGLNTSNDWSHFS